MTVRLLAGVSLAIVIFSGCDQSPPTDPKAAPVAVGKAWFRDVTAASGIDFAHQSGHVDRFMFPEIMGGGVALFDMDNDGDLDVYCVQSGKLGEPDKRGANQVYRNDGSGKFENATASSGAGDQGYGMGVVAGDYDADGDIDLYVTNVGRNALLQNDGTGKFTDVTAAAGVGDQGWGTSAAFADVDGDGDLDLYLCNYVAWSIAADLTCNNRAGQPDYCSPNSYSAPQPDILYRNNGDGTFTNDIKAGMRTSFGNGLGVVCGDFDGDQKIDIFVANDQLNNQYWINQGDGTFVDQAMMKGCAVDKNGKAKAGMGTCAADIDGDDDLDLLVVNLQAQSDSFFRNEGDFFVDETPFVGLGTSTRPFTRFGVGWVDFDNDGTLDLFEANGRVTLPDKSDVADPFAEPNVLLVGDGTKFAPAPTGALPTTRRTSRAAGFGDLDNDGDVDIVVINKDAPPEVLINEIGSENNWLLVRVLDQAGNDAIGAVVRFCIGSRTVRRDVNPHYSYLASNDPRVHLGLGQANRVDDVTVTWIDGSQQSFGPQSANQQITLQKIESSEG